MIAKSDLIILAVSGTALLVGVLRWQSDLGAPSVAAIAPPPPVERVVETPPGIDPPAAPVVGNVSRESPGRSVDAAGEPGEERIVVRRVPDTAEPRDAAEPRDTAELRDTAEPRDAAGPESADGAVTAAPDASPLYGRHVIENGEYLSLLAERFGTSVTTLQSINGIDGTTILVGDELLYPLPAN